MAKITRTKEIWHIPKRGNVHQTIYMVNLLTWDKFLQKSWSSGKQEAIASEMGKAGVTENGHAISHQSVRTLLANIPKYLGFVYIDDSSTPSRVFVTDVGYKLIEHHDIVNVPKHRNLKEYELSGDLIEVSDVFKQQMSKLIITNPSILSDCQNILVFPFRMTLRLLLELDYLDKEEIGYILFHTKSEDEFPLLVEKIKNFRTLPPEKRQAEIDAYKLTDEGKLTLVLAPSAGYYMYLCFSTGLCERFNTNVNKVTNKKLTALKLKDKEMAKSLIEVYKDAETYDFKDNGFLWNEYFSKPSRLFPPFDVSLTTSSEEEILTLVVKDKYIIASDMMSSTSKPLEIPVFKDEEYQIISYILNTGEEIFNDKISFNTAKRSFLIDINQELKNSIFSFDELINRLEEMFSGKYEGFDKSYHRKLEVIKKVLDKNYIDNRRKGGRLEYLFFDLLTRAKDKELIDEVYWYGKIGQYGICEPAPGGKDGNPDIVFEIDDYSFVLELTTIRDVRAQWGGSEASSVPDHIQKFQTLNPQRKVIGIFSAPSIHSQLAQNLLLNARHVNVGMLFEPCIEFAKLLSTTNRQDLKQYLIDKSTKQLS